MSIRQRRNMFKCMRKILGKLVQTMFPCRSRFLMIGSYNGSCLGGPGFCGGYLQQLQMEIPTRVRTDTVVHGVLRIFKSSERISYHIEAAAEIYRENSKRGAMLVKPNTLRAIELCVHTILNYGHSLNCSEVVLEAVNHTLKDWLEINTHVTSHLSGIEKGMTGDWLGRLYKLYLCWIHGNHTEKVCSVAGILRLILGEKGWKVVGTFWNRVLLWNHFAVP